MYLFKLFMLVCIIYQTKGRVYLNWQGPLTGHQVREDPLFVDLFSTFCQFIYNPFRKKNWSRTSSEPGKRLEWEKIVKKSPLFERTSPLLRETIKRGIFSCVMTVGFHVGSFLINKLHKSKLYVRFNWQKRAHMNTYKLFVRSGIKRRKLVWYCYSVY